MRKRIEIDKLLEWAFREELPKGHPVSMSAWDLIELGMPVDGGGPVDGLGFVPGAAHEDAKIIGDAVRALDAETRLDQAQCSALLGDFAPLDPLTIKAVMQSPFSMRALIIRCATLGAAMVWDIGSPAPRPMMRYPRIKQAISFFHNAEGVMTEAKVNGRGNYPPGTSTPIEWGGEHPLVDNDHPHRDTPTIGVLLETRAEYVIWYCALIRLIALLDGTMRDHEAIAPRVRFVPWITGQAPEPTVLKPLRMPPATRSALPLAPERGIKAGAPMPWRWQDRGLRQADEMPELSGQAEA
jgi:hypothetical protein